VISPEVAIEMPVERGPAFSSEQSGWHTMHHTPARSPFWGKPELIRRRGKFGSGEGEIRRLVNSAAQS
jgi:hypothetical protein